MSGQLLAGRVAVITGASRGLGAATAVAMAAAGADVVLAARDAAALERVAHSCSAHGHGVLVVPTDVSDAGAVEHMVDQAVSAFGRLDVAFNNAAGGGQRPTPFHELPVDSWDSAITISLRGLFLSMKYELPAMLAAGGGAIVNMASTAGVQAVGGMAPYVAAKHGVIGLTKTAALEYASRGIRANVVAPGPILTDALHAAGPEMQQRAGGAVPMQRVGQPSEVASTVVWLCSDQAGYVTGATVPIDGGMLTGMVPFAQMSGGS